MHGNRSHRRPPRGPLVAGGLVLTVFVLIGVGYALTPHSHVAPGCMWWTARQVGDVVAGQRGCVRGYFLSGGALGESSGGGFSLPLILSNPDTPATKPGCAFKPGEAVVVRYHSVFDDGQTLLVLDDCR